MSLKMLKFHFSKTTMILLLIVQLVILPNASLTDPTTNVEAQEKYSATIKPKGKESVDTALALQIPTALEVKDVNVSHPQQQSIESLEIVQLLKATNPQGKICHTDDYALELCHFPFKYKGKTYKSCTLDGCSFNPFEIDHCDEKLGWCAVSVDGSGVYDDWDHCDKPISNVPNRRNGRECYEVTCYWDGHRHVKANSCNECGNQASMCRIDCKWDEKTSTCGYCHRGTSDGWHTVCSKKYPNDYSCSCPRQCAVNKCQNGGTCYASCTRYACFDDPEDSRCDCPNGYVGDQCQLSAIQGYTWQGHKGCDDAYGFYLSVEHAIEHCTQDTNCTSVFASDCYTRGVFKLCPANGRVHTVGTQSCIYDKDSARKYNVQRRELALPQPLDTDVDVQDSGLARFSTQFTILANMYCAIGYTFTNAVNLGKAKLECNNNPYCGMFYDVCSSGTNFNWCWRGRSTLTASTCNSKLYIKKIPDSAMIIEKVNGPVFVVNGGSMDNEFEDITELGKGKYNGGTYGNGGLSIPNKRRRRPRPTCPADRPQKCRKRCCPRDVVCCGSRCGCPEEQECRRGFPFSRCKPKRKPCRTLQDTCKLSVECCTGLWCPGRQKRCMKTRACRNENERCFSTMRCCAGLVCKRWGRPKRCMRREGTNPPGTCLAAHQSCNNTDRKCCKGLECGGKFTKRCRTCKTLHRSCDKYRKCCKGMTCSGTFRKTCKKVTVMDFECPALSIPSPYDACNTCVCHPKPHNPSWWFACTEAGCERKKSKLEGELCHIPAENCVSNLTCVDKWKDVVGPKDVGVCEKIGDTKIQAVKKFVIIKMPLKDQDPVIKIHFTNGVCDVLESNGNGFLCGWKLKLRNHPICTGALFGCMDDPWMKAFTVGLLCDVLSPNHSYFSIYRNGTFKVEVEGNLIKPDWINPFEPDNCLIDSTTTKTTISPFTTPIAGHAEQCCIERGVPKRCLGICREDRRYRWSCDGYLGIAEWCKTIE